MKILVLLKKSLQFIGLIEISHSNGKLLAKILRIVLTISTCYITMTSIWFVIFESPPYEELARGSASVFVHMYCCIQYITLVVRRRSFFAMLDSLEAGVSAREFTANGNIYKETNERLEKTIRTCGSLALAICMPPLVIPRMIQSFYSYYVLDLGKSSFILSFPASYPYDWQTPCGYLATSVYLMFQMSCNNTIHFNCCFLFYSICQFVIAFIADFRLSLSRLDAEFRGSTPLGSHCSSADGIRFHTDLKQLADHCYSVYSSILFAFFTCGLYYWCVILLQFQVVLEIGDPFMLLTAIVCMALYLPFMLFVCNLGEHVTMAFDRLNVSIYMLSWHLCPVDLQKYMVAMIQTSAKSYDVPVFGSMDCSRDSFKEVISKGYSYFMMLRRMS